jgi:hypothetical protein
MVGSISGVRVHLPPHSKAVLACAFASAHVLVGCSSVTFFEMLMCAVLFYVLCAIVILCAPFVPPSAHSERSACSVLHLCAPVLFVHLYPTIASVLVLVGAHARLIYSSMHLRKQESGKAEPAGDGRDGRDASPRVGKSSEYSELAMKLAAAKRAHGIP